MELFECTICNFSTLAKFNFQRHLKTQKHLKKCSESSKNVEKCGKMWKNVEKKRRKIPKRTQKNSLFLNQNLNRFVNFAVRNFLGLTVYNDIYQFVN